MPRNIDIAPMRSPRLRKPKAEDGAEIWDLVRNCAPLDENSLYCNLLQADHFSDTCVVAEMDGKIVGWISGYVKPSDPETFFVWQVAVAEAARGLGLGLTMLQHLVDRSECDGVSCMQTTITADNEASWALFRKFARKFGAQPSSQAQYTQAVHFRSLHKTEYMLTIDLSTEVHQQAA